MSTMGETAASVHASCVAIGEAGVLLVGESGAGKTSLAVALVDEGRRSARFTRLVSDDRTTLEVRNGRLVARPHPTISGQVELRGAGVVHTPFEQAVVVRLVIQCLRESPDRMPASCGRWRWGDISLPSVKIGLNNERIRLAEWALDALGRDITGPAAASPCARRPAFLSDMVAPGLRLWL